MTTKIPPHTKLLYDLIDVLDEVAMVDAPLAQRYATRALAQGAKEYPGAAQLVLGQGRAIGLGIVHKQAQAAQGRIDRAVTALKAKMGDDQVAQVLETLSEADPAKLAAALQLGAPGSRGSSLADGEKLPPVSKQRRPDLVSEAITQMKKGNYK